MKVQELLEQLSMLDPEMEVIAGNPANQEGGFWVVRAYEGGWIGDGEMMGAAGETHPAVTLELREFTS